MGINLEKARLLAGIGVIPVAFVTVVACGNDDPTNENNDGTSGTQTTGTSAPADPAPTQQVEMPGSGIADLPVVSEGDPIALDSTDLANQPPAADKPCGYLVEWEDLANCMRNNPDYVRGINRNAGDAGFDWNGVELMAKVDRDARYIVIIGDWEGQTKPSEAEARAQMKALLPDLRDDTPVVYRDCLVNTRYADLQPFWHCQDQVRVSLAPFVYENGQLKVRYDAGVFVDCYNEHWLARPVVFTPPPPTTIPPSSTPPPTTTTTRPPRTTTTTPPRTTPPTTTPPTTTTTGKDSCEIPGQPCAEGDGGTIIYGPEQSRPETPAPWKTEAPPRVTQEPEYTPAPLPSPEPVPDSTPVPSAEQTPAPPPATGAAPEDDAADDYAPPPGT